VLGDIVHSSPFYVKETNTVYIGANDGMLHAFNAVTGQELFAYIPSAMMPKLKNLSSPSYTHDYFVDGDIAVSSQSDTGGKNYLVATLGRGGKGLFGLDVTTPDSFDASHVKWECFATGGTVSACNGDNDLGYMLGRPVIAKMNDGNWAVIVGNGYNSSSGKAVLYIFKLDDGTLLQKIDTGVAGDNGLASPGVFDSNGDGKIDFIYAGDLKGNVWEFDVSSSSPSAWGLAFGGAPLFVAKDPSNNPQPITAQITVAVNDVVGDSNYGKRYIFFGTGSYFRSGDPSDTQLQSWYGLIDEGGQITSRSQLKQRSIVEEGVFDGKTVRVFSEATVDDMAGKKGWYLDFTTHPGERIVTTSKLYRLVKPTLIASSIIPVVDPCVPGGNGFINAIDPFSGARVSVPIFDVNNNGDFTDDKLNGNYIGGFDPNVGMPSEPRLVGDRLAVGGSSGNVTSVKVNYGTKRTGRISWREIILQ
jgi:type IV pilus assembly protein PilY1